MTCASLYGPYRLAHRVCNQQAMDHLGQEYKYQCCCKQHSSNFSVTLSYFLDLLLVSSYFFYFLWLFIQELYEDTLKAHPQRLWHIHGYWLLAMWETFGEWTLSETAPLPVQHTRGNSQWNYHPGQFQETYSIKVLASTFKDISDCMKVFIPIICISLECYNHCMLWT